MDAQTRWAMTHMKRYLRDGNYAAAVEIGERVLARDDQDVATYLFAASNLALAYERQKRWEDSLHWLRACLTLEPANPASQAGYGRVLMGMGNVGAATAIFTNLARLYPGHSGYQAGAGSCLLRLGDLKGALPYLRRARELDPTNPYVLNDLASVYLLDGDFEASLSAFRQAIENIREGDRELACDIRASIEEVRAAVALRQSVDRSPAAARVAEVREVYPERPEGARRAAATPAADTGRAEAPRAFADSTVRQRVLDALIERGSRPRQILGALRMWAEFLESVPREAVAHAERRAECWAAAVVYAVGRLDGERWAVQRAVAKEFAVSTSALASRFAQLRRMLNIEVGDPRYSSVPSRKRSALIEQIHGGRIANERLLL